MPHETYALRERAGSTAGRSPAAPAGVFRERSEVARGFRRGFGWCTGVACSVACLIAAVLITYHAVVLATAGSAELASAWQGAAGPQGVTRDADPGSPQDAGSAAVPPLDPAAPASPPADVQASHGWPANLGDTTISCDCGLRVTSARFYYVREGQRQKPVMDLRIRNDTRQTVAKMHFCARLCSPNREQPWAEDVFEHAIDGGLPPGVEIQMQLLPENTSPWADAPPDDTGLELTIVPITIEDAAGKRIRE